VPEDPETLGIIASAGRRRRAIKAAAAVLIVAVVLGGAFAVRLLISRINEGGGTPSRQSTVSSAGGAAAAPVAPSQAVQPAAVPEAKAEEPGAGAAMATIEARKALVRNMGQRPPLPQKKPVEPRQVKIFVKPYADIFVDGRLVATDARDHVASVEPGPHRLEFRNKFFEPQETAVEIPETDPVKDVRVELSKVRPGFLRVSSAPAADVWVDDVYKGPSAGTIKEPVVIPMPKGKGARVVRLRVVKQGFKSHVENVELQPGATREVKVTLMPEGR
jgi:hypothetical protein